MRRIAVLGLLVAILAAAACTRLDPGRNDVLRALANAGGQARRVTYVERASGARGEVIATILDDFRYDLQLTVDGTPGAHEVVVDDARALQATPGVLPEIASAGAEIPAALAAGGWVVDPDGAKGLFRPPARRGVRRDRMTEALDILAYVRDLIRQAPGVTRFNPDATTYRKEFDPFPAPTSGVIRYDLSVPRLSPQSASTGGAAALRPPGVRYFRRVALFVADGEVVEFRENVSVRRALIDPTTNLVQRLGDYDITLPEGTPTEQAAALLRTLNGLATQQGIEPIRERDLHVRFAPLERGATVDLPSDATEASLTGILDHGQLLSEVR